MRILITLYIVTLILGCSDFDKFYWEKRIRPKALKGSSVVVAIVGGDEITREDLIKSLKGVPERQRVIYLSTPQGLRGYLDSYINQMVLYKEAERRGIERREGIRESLEMYKRRLLIQVISQEILSQKIMEEDIKKYYDENLKDFEQIRISRIFIKVDPEKEITKDKVRAKAELIAKRANTGEKFEKLVEEFSDDIASKKKGGDFGYLSRGRLSPEIENKIFSLKKGEISDPIETENGFHIIKVTEGAKVLPLDQVKGRIQVELRKKILSEYTKKLREKMGEEIFEDKLKEISISD